jgi:hypothetical protein
MSKDQSDASAEVDPQEFLRAVLKISPEDAEKVREDTPGTRKRPEPQHDGNEEGPAK